MELNLAAETLPQLLHRHGPGLHPGPVPPPLLAPCCALLPHHDIRHLLLPLGPLLLHNGDTAVEVRVELEDLLGLPQLPDLVEQGSTPGGLGIRD